MFDDFGGNVNLEYGSDEGVEEELFAHFGVATSEEEEGFVGIIIIFAVVNGIVVAVSIIFD